MADWCHFIVENAYRLQDVKQRVVGEPLDYDNSHLPLARTRPEQLALIRRMCSEMQEEMRKLMALGGQVPDDPMVIIDLWLSID